MRRRIYSKTMFIRVKKATNKTFVDAVKKVLKLTGGPRSYEVTEAIYGLRTLKFNAAMMPTDEAKPLLAVKEEVDNVYLQDILTLPTKILEDILTVHEFGTIKRASRTLESIIYELTRRSIFDDTSESDTKNANGAVDGTRRKTSKDRSRTKAKKRSTGKGRS